MFTFIYYTVIILLLKGISSLYNCQSVTCGDAPYHWVKTKKIQNDCRSCDFPAYSALSTRGRAVTGPSGPVLRRTLTL